MRGRGIVPVSLDVIRVSWNQELIKAMLRHACLSVATIAFGVLLGGTVIGDDGSNPDPMVIGSVESGAMESGPMVYSQDDPCACECWPGLMGECYGVRPSLKESGITLDADLTQFYLGVAHGGIRETFNYAGHGDYLLNVDFDKLAGIQGLSMTVRAEHRFGEFLGPDAGMITPVNLHAATPTIATEDLILTNVLFTQVVNENLMVLFGKLDTLDGDRNPFASGRGKTQFMNTSLVEPVAGIPTVPFATLGAGAVFLVDGLPAAQVLVLNATNTITTSGFDELFAEGAAVLGGVNVPLPIAGKLGIHSFTAAWNSKTFTSLGQDPRIITGNVPIAAHDGSWVAWWSGTQYLYQDPNDPMKGWGLFGRLGMAEPRTSPIESFMNFGIGGQSPIAGRENDLFGVGWFYNRSSGELGPIATGLLGIGNYSTGVELFYNYAVTPYFRVSPDLQIIEPAATQANTALILGVRCQIDF